jgi:uncharacterized membrane protein YcaP (DUF421 family)
VQNSIIGNDNSITGGIIGATTLLTVNFLVVRFLFRHPRLEARFEGRAELLISNGVSNEALLKKELITIPELEMAAHKQGIQSLADVEKAEIDQDGELFFVGKPPLPEQARHAELLGLLAQLSAELREVRAEVEAR